MADELNKERAKLPPLEENVHTSEADVATLDLKDQDSDGDASLGGIADAL